MTVPVHPQARAVPMACTARLAARGGGVPAAQPGTGAGSGMLITAARPRTSSDFPCIFVCPNLAPCFACP